MIVFDCETGPLPDAELLEMLPAFVPPPHPGEFDPSTVKVGNLGEIKAAYKIQEARLAHAEQVEHYARNVAFARMEQANEFKSKAALSPLTGRVLAIGLCKVDPRPGTATQPEIIGLEPSFTEYDILQSFWDSVLCDADQERWAGWNIFGQERWAGWNIFGFDLPFLVRRSWRLGVEIPPAIRDSHDRYWSPQFVDLMRKFQVGNPSERYTKLDDAARFFGVGSKGASAADGGCDGAAFAGLWLSTSGAEREKAVEYLINDLAITAGVARRMGLAG